MNNTDGVESGGAPYVPSARKSIHQHDRCIFTNCADNMGRYGLNSRREVKTIGSSPHHGQGTDEVDNVMSKFSRQTSPVPVRQKKAHRKDRRNSLNSSDPEFSDDNESDSNLLAKSLPANLPSYYCSNDIAHRSLPNDFYKAQYSPPFAESRNNSQVNQSKDYYRDESTSASFEKYTHENESTQRSGKSCQQVLLSLTVAILSLAAAFYYNGFLNFTQAVNSNHYDELRFNMDMYELGEKYKINDNSILEVQSGISTILERNDTGSFIFLYNGKSVDFDYLQFRNFMQDIAITAARYLRNESKSHQPTVVHSSELKMQSHSELMNKYRPEVDETGVMLVNDVDRIPSSLAMAFHYFCDEFNPLVAKSAIFFTLNLANCSNLSDQKSVHSDVEKCLANIWNTVPKDNIKPLLARVVNVVIDVTNIN